RGGPLTPYAVPVKPGRPIWVEWRVPLCAPTESKMVVPLVSSMCQSATRAGGGGGGGGTEPGRTTAVGTEEAVALPAMLLAETVTSSVLPTSAEEGVYVGAVTPEIGLQLAPLESQRCHW